jgi:hypothetical protein
MLQRDQDYMNEAIRLALRTLYRKGDVVELRGWDKEKKVWVARCDYGIGLLNVLTCMDEELELECYMMLNPSGLPPTPLMIGGKGTWEHEVLLRRWFLLDCDPVRDYKIATEGQFQHALAVAKNAKAWLESYSWANIVMASSGNGVHLLVPCDLPNDAEAKATIRHIQVASALKFSNEHAKIECFCDADRITRAYGTVNRKGKETDTLKWRRSGIIE